MFHCFLISDSFAQSSIKESPSAQLKIIANTCLTSPFSCLQNIDKALLAAPKHSRIYFEILQYKMEALFNLQKGDALYQETKKWINMPDLPLPFQVTNAIYFAKSAWHIGEKEEARENYLLAKSLLSKMNEVYPSPLRLVQFANLQMQLKEYQEAYDLMSGLAKKYTKSPDIRFLVELHGNLGHVANRLGNIEQSLIHWQETKKWVHLFGNKQQIAVVLYNLADIHVKLAQYNDAEKHYNEAIIFAVEAGDKVKANQARYHLLTTQLKQRSICKDNTLFTTIEAEFLPKNSIYDIKSVEKNFIPC
ncbi:MAG: tetratricopeptide repeat protein [Colwelliaceae bacterium]|nr:tetratricopeptide repeat protein [Colwelliaceae bacterium]